VICDFCRHTSNEKLAPLNVRVREESAGTWKGAFDCCDNDVMGRLELGEGRLQARKDDKVAQGCPLCSGQSNIGMMGFRSEGLIAHIHEVRSWSHCL
jgi:hypothetical protein